MTEEERIQAQVVEQVIAAIGEDRYLEIMALAESESESSE